LAGLLRDSAPTTTSIKAFEAMTAVPREGRSLLSGTLLQWWGGRSSPCEFPPGGDIVVDFFGGRRPSWHDGRFFHFVDETGYPILAPYSYAWVSYSRMRLATLHLIEQAKPDGDWRLIGEAHHSAQLSWRMILDRIGKSAAVLLWHAITHPSHSTVAMAPLSGQTRGWRSRGEGIAARISSAAGYVRHRLQRVVYTDRWSIGITETQIETILSGEVTEKVNWLKSESSLEAMADPFPVPGLPQTFLCEIYSYATDLGKIGIVEAVNGKIVSVRPVGLPSKTHLSYPFLFKENGAVYCIPENAQSCETAIYELRSPSMALVGSSIIQSGRPVVDPTLFKWHGKYWIAYTDLGIGRDDNLCLMSASTLMGPWTPHPGNPVKIDIRSARSAGPLFEVDGNLYRPAQDCSRTYGGAIIINRIRQCDESNFSEEFVCKVKPRMDGPCRDGLHTLSAFDGGLIIDGKRTVINPVLIFLKLWHHTAKQAHLQLAESG